jgi:tetratricopeptide (TPR) repeat protein
MVDEADPEMEAMYHIYELMAWIDFFWNRERLLLKSVKALNHAERKGFRSGIARGSMAMGLIFDFIGMSWLAGKYHRRSAALVEELQSPVDAGQYYLGLAFHQDFLGDWETATRYYGVAADLFWKAGDVRRWGCPMCMTGFLHNFRGEFAQSLDLFQKSVQIGEKCGDQFLTGWSLRGRALNLICTGDLDEAIAHLEKSVELLEAVPDYYACGIARQDLGRCYLRQGRIEDALEVLEETNKNFSELGLTGHFVNFVRNALAAAHLAVAEQTGGFKNASTRRKCKRACKAAVKESKGYAWALPEAYRLQGTYYWLKGDTNVAAKWWDGSLESARGLGAKYELGVTYLEMGKRMRDSSHLKEAETIFKEIGATLDLSQTLELMKLGNQVE